jgi:hypothetical protein
MKKIIVFLFLCAGLGLWSGCQTYQGTKFAPLAAQLDATGSEGTRSIALSNSGSQALHNVHFQAYVWGRGQPAGSQPTLLMSVNEQPEPVQAQTYTFMGSATKMEPGETLHFMGQGTLTENRILQSVMKLQITGGCDEGQFRETWVMGDNGMLELVGVPRD